jgi:hypothetical protein
MRIFEHHDLHHGGVERFFRINRGGAAFDVMDVRAFVDDDEGPFELARLSRY